MDVPEKCKDCSWLRFLYNADNSQYPACMLNRPFALAAGCPNKTKDPYNRY